MSTATHGLQSHARQEELWAYVAGARPQIEHALLAHLPSAPAQVESSFNEALRYALFPGGKRLRPVLTLLGAELVGGDGTGVLPAAAAVEYVHTSSLIFDDLPCMDDAAERRGRSSLHATYGEGLAVLVGLALMNASYGLVFEGAGAHDGRAAIRAHKELVECIGARGMVAGQSVDLAGATHDGGAPDDEGAEYDAVRSLKTSALMRLALRVGAILSGADARQLAALSRYAELLGVAYQLKDDLLDLDEDAAFAGPRRVTAAARGGVRAGETLAALVGSAKDALLNHFGPARPALLLCAMADYIAARES